MDNREGQFISKHTRINMVSPIDDPNPCWLLVEEVELLPPGETKTVHLGAFCFVSRDKLLQAFAENSTFFDTEVKVFAAERSLLDFLIVTGPTEVAYRQDIFSVIFKDAHGKGYVRTCYPDNYEKLMAAVRQNLQTAVDAHN